MLCQIKIEMITYIDVPENQAGYDEANRKADDVINYIEDETRLSTGMGYELMSPLVDGSNWYDGKRILCRLHQQKSCQCCCDQFHH